MYRSVHDLRAEELSELKSAMFWDDDAQEVFEGTDIDCPEGIPDSLIFDHYRDYIFTDGDFFCNL